MVSTILSNFKKKAGKPILIGFPVFFILLFSWFRVFELYELQTYDWRCQIRGARPVHSDIVLIDIWDDTLKELGAWPFDREYHADLIKVLSSAGARAVAMDILFVEPKPGDERVAQAAKDSGIAYFVYAFLQPEERSGGFVADQVLAPLLPAYEAPAKATGHVNTHADLDGKRRKVYPVIEHEGKSHYQLSFRVAMDVLGIDPANVRYEPGRFLELSKDLRVPVDDKGYFLVNYAGRWETAFQHYSYYDVLAAYLETLAGEKPRIDLSTLKNKICFVGLTSLGSHDTSPVPIQSIYPMVGLHANVLNNILNKDFIWRLDRVWNLLILVILSAWIVYASLKYKPLKALVLALATLVIFALGVIGAFHFWGLWADLFYPFVLLIIIYAVSTLGRTLYEIKKREVIENELKIASQIQQSFLPSKLPDVKGLEMAVFMRPAKAVGGDLYSFVTLDDDKFGVMLGDVSGKGTPAALFMAKVVSEFKFHARLEQDPGKALQALNNSISSESTGGLFVTLTYVIFDRKRHKMLLSNGGHLPMVLVKRSGETRLLSADEGMPIGVMDGVDFSSSDLPIEEGDCLALYSDGISEARNRRKDEFGVEALQGVMSENRSASPQDILDRSLKAVEKFANKAEQHDDMTLLIIKVGPDHGSPA